jgi:hypothetical protein
MDPLKNKLGILSLGLGILSISGCSSLDVKADKDPKANLAKYKTYAWAEEPKTTPNKKVTSILDETVKADVDQQLASKGLQKVPASQADLIVSYSAMTKNRISYGMSPGYYWGAGTEPYITPEGSLTVQMVDPKERRTVWQGTATEAVGSSGADQEQIAKAVEGIIQKYPTV